MDLDELVQELSRHPGRFALAVGDGSDKFVEGLAGQRSANALRVGTHLTRGDRIPADIPGEIVGSKFLVNMEILFSPQ